MDLIRPARLRLDLSSDISIWGQPAYLAVIRDQGKRSSRGNEGRGKALACVFDKKVVSCPRFTETNPAIINYQCFPTEILKLGWAVELSIDRAVSWQWGSINGTHVSQTRPPLDVQSPIL